MTSAATRIFDRIADRQQRLRGLDGRELALSLLSILALPELLCAAALAWFWWCAADCITYENWLDEDVSILGAKMIASGGLLYRDFVDSHGPLQFMMAHLFGWLRGWKHPNDARWMNVALTMLVLLAILHGSGWRGRWGRCWAVGLAAGFLAAAWPRLGLYQLNFYPLGGALAGVVLALWVAAPCRGGWVTAPQAWCAGLALGLLGASAYSFLPSAALFALSGFWASWRLGNRRVGLWLAAGLAAGGLVTLVWLLLFADVLGYLSFHIAENQTAYARYINFSWNQFLRSLLPHAGYRAWMRDIALAWLAMGLVILLALDHRRAANAPHQIGAILLGVLGVALLNARGGMIGFQDASFAYAAAVLAALAAADGLARLSPGTTLMASLGAIVLVFLLQAVGSVSEISPFGVTSFPRSARAMMPVHDAGAVYQRLRHFIAPDERFLALVFKPHLYLLVDRLPMQGYYAWFPWDAAYARAPWFGRSRDLCVALATSPPPVIVFDDLHLWGNAPADYMPCLIETLQRAYAPDPNPAPGLDGSVYIRRDRLAQVGGQ